MKRLTIAALAVLLLASVVYTQATAISIRVTVDGVNTDITFTARQVALLNRQLMDFNAARTASGQSTVTMGVFLRGFIFNALRAEEQQAEAHEQAEACAAYQALSAANQNAIKTALGGKSPCR